MIFKRYFLLLAGLALLGTLRAQKGSDGPAEAYRNAEKEFVLLRNENEILPLRRLDTLRIAFWPLQMKDEAEVSDMMRRYTKVDVLGKPPTVPTEREAWLAQLAVKYNLLIVGIDHTAGSDMHAEYGLAVQAATRQLTTVAMVLGNDMATAALGSLPGVEAIVYSPEDPLAAQLAPQLIFGGFGASGKLKKDLSGEFTLGYGLQSLGGFRFRYGPPELAGMNASLLEDSLRSIVQEGIDKGAYPGAQVIVVKNGVVVFREAFGHHTYESPREVRLDDLYDYASMTKITGALPALMKLHAEGKFKIDAPLALYFPDAIGSDKANLSFRRMLSHSARLRPWIPYWQGTLRGNARYPWDKQWNATAINEGRFRSFTIKPDSSRRFPIRLTDQLWLHRKFRERKIYKAIEESPFLEEPGYVYSGLLFYLLPEIVTYITHRNYEEYIDTEFYHKLGAWTITYNPMAEFPIDRIVPTEKDTFFRMEQLHGVVHDEGAAMMNGVSGNAGLFSTSDDLAKLMQMYMNYGHYGGEQLIPRGTVETFTSYQYPQEGIRRGLGFDKPLLEYDADASYVARSASPASFGHTGYTGTFAWADPEQDLLFIFFSNRVYPTRDNRKLYTLNIRPRMHQACYDAIGTATTGMR